MKLILAMISSVMVSASMYAATTYKSSASGDWNDSGIWTDELIPVSSGDEKVNILGHSVTNGAENLTVYNINVGANTDSSDSVFTKRGGSFTSSYLTEIGSHSSRTAPSVLELDGVDARFEKYRLVVGRGGGNARLTVKDSTIFTSASLLMGIGTMRDAALNLIELESSVWTNSGDIMFGHSSLGTNVIHLSDSTMYCAKELNIGYGGNNGTATGENFLIAEGSSVETKGAVNMPRNASQSAHLILSNSTLKASQLLLGYIAGTTNSLAFIDAWLPVFSTTSYIGYQPGTVSRVLIQNQEGANGKPTADGVLESLVFRSKTGERRVFEVEVVGGKWGGESEFCVSQENNTRAFTFRDLSLPVKGFVVGNYVEAPGTLALSNCVWKVPGVLRVAGQNGANGAFAAIDSDIECSVIAVSDDPENTEEQDVFGSFLLSGGSLTCGGEMRVRRGEGRIVLERGANLTCGRLYIPNMTGSKAFLEVGGGSTLLVTNQLCVGNQPETECEIVVKEGGSLIVSKDCEKAAIFRADPKSFVFTVTNDGSRIAVPYETAFATASGAEGTLNLAGGSFETMGFGRPKADASQVINFNGGTLRALRSGTLTGENSLNYVDAGGAVIETMSADDTVELYGMLRHGNGNSATDGGLRKIGSGSLLLRRANTFNGPVNVAEGSLVMACKEGPALPSGVSVTIDVVKGARLDRLDETCPYPSAMSISVGSDAKLEQDRKYVLAANWDSTCSVVVDLPEGWVARHVGSNLIARRERGLLIGIR